MLLPTVYEDGGSSGGTLERPGLQRLLDDIDAGLVDQIVVYKVDRLTRSLSDFAKLVERLEAAGAVFVSVTPSCAKTLPLVDRVFEGSVVFLDTTRSKRPGAPVLSSFVFLDTTGLHHDYRLARAA